MQLPRAGQAVAFLHRFAVFQPLHKHNRLSFFTAGT